MYIYIVTHKWKKETIVEIEFLRRTVVRKITLLKRGS